MWTYNYMNTDSLYHYGVLGMRWGHRNNSTYRPTSVRAAIAKRKNAKIDKSFKEWTIKEKNRDSAIELGKKYNLARLDYENNRNDISVKDRYNQTNKDYKKALKKNTSYHKGYVRKEVGKDISNKYLSSAKKIKKQLDSDPNNQNNEQLRRQYINLMNKHDIERNKARRALEVGNKRSNYKASIKRSMTMTVSAAAASAAIGVGVYAINKYLTNRNFTLNGKSVSVHSAGVRKVVDIGKKVVDLRKFVY